ncbi:hypothetical protein Gbfr_007_233 [Gluconobacter frateurii M-2]|nr:hypothetical protein Gbfr_007_233 [Gluconobacter frateurii M-2]
MGGKASWKQSSHSDREMPEVKRSKKREASIKERKLFSNHKQQGCAYHCATQFLGEGVCLRTECAVRLTLMLRWT